MNALLLILYLIHISTPPSNDHNSAMIVSIAKLFKVMQHSSKGCKGVQNSSKPTSQLTSELTSELTYTLTSELTFKLTSELTS